MSKTYRRSRQRRNKLSKKRGGGPQKPTVEGFEGRPPFLEHNGVVKKSYLHTPIVSTQSGNNTKIKAPTRWAGFSKVYTVNTNRDEKEQRKAFARFNIKYRKLQDYFIKFGSAYHNGLWICVKAGVGNWNPNDGSWEMLPEVVRKMITDNDYNSAYENGNILKDNANGIFWLPEQYWRRIPNL